MLQKVSPTYYIARLLEKEFARLNVTIEGDVVTSVDSIAIDADDLTSGPMPSPWVRLYLFADWLSSTNPNFMCKKAAKKTARRQPVCKKLMLWIGYDTWLLCMSFHRHLLLKMREWCGTISMLEKLLIQ